MRKTDVAGGRRVGTRVALDRIKISPVGGLGFTNLGEGVNSGPTGLYLTFAQGSERSFGALLEVFESLVEEAAALGGHLLTQGIDGAAGAHFVAGAQQGLDEGEGLSLIHI